MELAKPLTVREENLGITENTRSQVYEVLEKSEDSSFMFSSIPLKCKNHECVMKNACKFYLAGTAPTGSRCHPPGTLIQTPKGDIPIEDLNPETDTVYGFEHRHSAIRKRGYNFTKNYRYFNGMLVRVKNFKYLCDMTFDHHTFARFNENARDMFCVYLMRKENFWRIGKTRLFNSKAGGGSHKTVFGPAARTRAEGGDSVWILGVYPSNTEAGLMEEYFSLKSQTSRMAFKSSEHRKTMKWNGLYRWLTQEQIDKHHASLSKDPCFYAQFLQDMGLSVDYPFWKNIGIRKDGEFMKVGIGKGHTLCLNACNIIPFYMDIPSIPDIPKYDKYRCSLPVVEWSRVDIEKFHYDGVVYNLDVEKYHTYFANRIATHNCPVEIGLIIRLFDAYIKDLNVDPTNIVETSLIRDLVNIEIKLMRAAGKYAEEGDFEKDVIIGIGDDGAPLTKPELSNHVIVDEKLMNKKRDILKMMSATREEKLRNKQMRDPSTYAADLLEQVKVIENESQTSD